MTGAAAGPVEHDPLRPSWDCGSCGQPWPCAQAREQLAERYQDDPLGLAEQMGIALVDADRDGAAGPPREAYARWLGWVGALLSAGG